MTITVLNHPFAVIEHLIEGLQLSYTTDRNVQGESAHIVIQSGTLCSLSGYLYLSSSNDLVSLDSLLVAANEAFLGSTPQFSVLNYLQYEPETSVTNKDVIEFLGNVPVSSTESTRLVSSLDEEYQNNINNTKKDLYSYFNSLFCKMNSSFGGNQQLEDSNIQPEVDTGAMQTDPGAMQTDQG